MAKRKKIDPTIIFDELSPDLPDDETFKIPFNSWIDLDVDKATVSLLVEAHGEREQGKRTFVCRAIAERMTKDSVRYVKQFKCLNPHGQLSRLYLIPVEEIMRHYAKGKVTKSIAKRT